MMTTTAASGVGPAVSAARAFEELTWHRHYAYRGCAPDSDDPRRAAGDPGLSVDAWSAPTVAGETQPEREARERAAVEVCVDCPVMVLCHVYANAVDGEGRLVEPHGVLGGERALERHKRLVARRHELVAEAPDARFATEQKRAILKALALRWEPREVAVVADMDVRTANWQRADLVRLLRLPRDTSRMRLLEVAVERGLVKAAWVRADDGSVPARAPATKVVEDPVPRPRRSTGRRPLRSKFAAVAGQLQLDWDGEPAALTTAAPASVGAVVRSLSRSKRLEAAA